MKNKIAPMTSFAVTSETAASHQARKKMQASKLMQIRIHPGLYRIVRQASSDRFCDMSDYVRQALRERLERDGYSLGTSPGGDADTQA